MRSLSSRYRHLVLSAALVLGCAGAEPPAPGRQLGTPESDPQPVLLGLLSREEIEAALPEWVAATVDANPDLDTAIGLADLATNARVKIFFGSWCEDSQRELSRLWKALDLVGGDVGFPIEYIGVDRSKTEPATLVAGREILYVPTLIVEHEDHELGRIIESAPGGIESDLMALLSGAASGWISGREDLPASEDAGPR